MKLNATLLASLILICLVLNPLFPASANGQDLADIIEECEKSLVRIEVKGLDGNSLGSGFVVSKDGLIVTNVHVLAGAEKAIVIFPDDRAFEIVGTIHIDEGRDICIAKLGVGGQQLTPIKLAAALPRKGERVTAMGSPLGLSFTATTGIISAIREGEELGRDIGDSSMKGTWVQVDASLSPGNSGGPLINSKGEVVAMSTRASTGDAQNLNFGISIRDIREAIKKSEGVRQITLAAGVGKVKMHESSGGAGSNSIVTRREIPQSSLDRYVQRTRDSYNELAKRVRRKASDKEDRYRMMRKGQTGFPPGVPNDVDAVVQQYRGSEKMFFRDADVKDQLVSEIEAEVDKLKKLKSALSSSDKEKALKMLLMQYGARLDPQRVNSVGFMEGAVVLHAFNDHDIAIGYRSAPFLMWVESTAGLALGTEIKAAPVFVSGTETMELPGKGTMALTILQKVTEQEIEKTLGTKSKTAESFVTWRAKSGHTVDAKLIKNDGTHVHLENKEGQKITVPLSILDEESLAQLKKR